MSETQTPLTRRKGEGDLPTIYVFCNQCTPTDWHPMVAITEEGEGIAGHVCSSHGWVAHDMGFTSDWHHDSYDKVYPDGWRLEWVPDPDKHPGCLEAIAKAHLGRHPGIAVGDGGTGSAGHEGDA